MAKIAIASANIKAVIIDSRILGDAVGFLATALTAAYPTTAITAAGPNVLKNKTNAIVKVDIIYASIIANLLFTTVTILLLIQIVSILILKIAFFAITFAAVYPATAMTVARSSVLKNRTQAIVKVDIINMLQLSVNTVNSLPFMEASPFLIRIVCLVA